MHTVKVRRAGNSNAITLPRELEALGFTVGAEVMLETLEYGELLVVPAEQIRAHIHEIGRRVIAEHRMALELLATYDRGEIAVPPPSTTIPEQR